MERMIAYLTQVSHPTIKNIVERVDSNEHSVKKLATSVSEVKDYIISNVNPIQSSINEVREDQIKLNNLAIQNSYATRHLEQSLSQSSVSLSSAVVQLEHHGLLSSWRKASK